MVQVFRAGFLAVSLVSGGLLVLSHVVSFSGVPLFLSKLSFALGVTGTVISSSLLRLLGQDRTKTILLNALVLCVSLTCAAIIGEWTVRLAFGDITTTSDNHSYFALQWKKHAVSVNSWSFREREFQSPKPKGTYRIAVIGDSITYGQGIPEHARFTNLLQDKLEGSAPDFEVLNFGRPGAETIDELDTLKDVVERANPDFVLLQWFVNDMEGRNYSGRPNWFPLVPSSTLHSLLHKSSALYFLMNLQWVNIQRVAATSLRRQDTYVEYMGQRFGDTENGESKRYRDELVSFIDFCKRNDVRLGMVLVPMVGRDVPLGYLLDRVLEVCRQESITCLDMRPAFTSYSGTRELWVNRFDSHPNALAHYLMSEQILGAFQEAWLTEAANRHVS